MALRGKSLSSSALDTGKAGESKEMKKTLSDSQIVLFKSKKGLDIQLLKARQRLFDMFSFKIIDSIRSNIRYSLSNKQIEYIFNKEQIVELKKFEKNWNIDEHPYNDMLALLEKLNKIVPFQEIFSKTAADLSRWKAIKNLDYQYELDLIRLFQNPRLFSAENLLNLYQWIKSLNYPGSVHNSRLELLKHLIDLVNKILQKVSDDTIHLHSQLSVYAKHLLSFILNLEKLLPEALNDLTLLKQILACPAVMASVSIETSSKEDGIPSLKVWVGFELEELQQPRVDIYDLTVANLDKVMLYLLCKCQKSSVIAEQEDSPKAAIDYRI